MFSGHKLAILIQRLHIRYYVADKQLLSQLRKSTGFSFVNCRQALEKFDNDLKQAEAWLKERAQKEGWAKASKLQSRPMSQGLVGVAVQDKAAAIVEVNCETDFVARNSKFQNFVSVVANACLQHGSTLDANCKVVMDSRTIASLIVNDKSIGDLTALEVGNIGENLAARRAVYLRAVSGQQLVASYVHSTGAQSSSIHSSCALGKYGALLVYEASLQPPQQLHLAASGEGAVGVSIDELGRRLCQHIVGMHPQSVGSVNDEQPAGDPESETRLIYQEYMLDTTLTVHELLQQCGVSIVDFVRLECGETLAGEL
jgi:elongation factor Ts